MRKRAVLSSVNLLVTVLLLGVLFIMVNWLASERYSRWDLTQQRMSQLSGQTRQVLSALEEPITITRFFQPDHRLVELVGDLLEEYQRLSPQVRVVSIDPDQDLARAKQLVQQLQIEEYNVIIVQSGDRHKHLSEPELAEYDYQGPGGGVQPRIKTFKGENAVTSAILSITQAEQPLIWFTTGHGEKSLDDSGPEGLSALKRDLEQQNLLIESANLLESEEVPAKVRMLVIAGPTHRFIESEHTLLDAYLTRGGGLLALLDPLTETGLEPLLTQWGMELGEDVVVDPAQQLPFMSAANLFVTTYSQHPIVENMKMLMTLFPLARSIRPIDPAPEGITVAPLAITSPRGWAETSPDDPTFTFREGEDLPGPVPIAIASHRTEPVVTRVVVFGDSDFIANGQLDNVGNKDLVLGAAHWLVEQEQLIGISPKPLETIKLSLTARKLSGMFWFSLLVMPALCGLLGTATWWRRRR